MQKASGATKFAKGDVKASGLLAECKTTSKSTYSLKHADLKKIALEAVLKNYSMWCFQVEFQGAGIGSKYAILDYGWFRQMFSRHGSGKLLEEEDLNGEGAKSVTLLQGMIFSARGRSAVAGTQYVLRIRLGAHLYALISWTEFQQLYDAEKELEQ